MAGYVYLIGTSIYGWYKIGKSKTPEVRVTNLGILLPFKIKVYRVWKAANHDLMEKTLHEMYAANRINGEWFQFTKVQLSKMIKAIPAEVVVSDDERLDQFSNISEDIKQAENANYTGRVIGVRVEKLRGNFTPEERLAKKDANSIEARDRRAMRDQQMELFPK